jgi:hypothetical protein
MPHEEVPETVLPEAVLLKAAAAQDGASIDAATWAWATEHGAPEWASTEQLITWLGRGELPPHTLVWKQGWGEWLPALQVAALAAAFPRVTAGSRRVARAASGNAAMPPAVPIAHYPRLRLLAKDVLSESPLPPAVAAHPLAPVQAERRALRDPDHQQQDVVTSQVPAAAMLAAAHAMKQSGALATRSSAERWGRLELGTFGAAAPPALPPTALAALPPAALLPPARSLPPPRTGYGRWLSLGALLGGALGLLSAAWPGAAELAARAVLSFAAIALTEAAPVEPLRVLDTRALSLSPLAESACLAPVEAAPLASISERTHYAEATVSSVPEVSALPVRVLRTRPRRSASSQPTSPLSP